MILEGMLQNKFFAVYTGASLSGIIISKCSEGFCSIDAAASLPVLSGVNTPVYLAYLKNFFGKNIFLD